MDGVSWSAEWIGPMTVKVTCTPLMTRPTLEEVNAALVKALEGFRIGEKDIVGGQADALIVRLPIKAIQDAAAALDLARAAAVKEG